MLIGITGTNGAGKGTIAQHLNQHHKFTYISVRNFFAGELIRQGKAHTREAVARVAAELKAAHGQTYALEQLLVSSHGNVVIESIRTPQEVAYLKAKGGMVWAVDADVETRFQRTQKRDLDMGAITRQQFMANEATDAALGEVIAKADVHINCDGSLQDVHTKVEQALAKAGYKE